MTDERREELAALAAMHFLDATEQRELQAAYGEDLVREFSDIYDELTLTAPAVPPPPELKGRIMDQLSGSAASSKIVPFVNWVPYAIAACLMLLGIGQAVQISGLRAQARALQANLDVTVNEANRLRDSYAMKDLELADLPEAAGAQTN